MRTVSDRFAASLRVSHTIATQAELHFPGKAPIEVPVVSGTVTFDRTAQIRCSAQLTIPWSLDAGEDLGVDLRELPLGGYATLKRGLRYSDRTSELVQLGYLRVESVTWQTSDQQASLELADRMAQVRDEPFVVPYSPAATGPQIVQSGNLTHGSALITGLSSTAGMLVGMSIVGQAVPAGARIKTIDSAVQVTMSVSASLVASKDCNVRGGPGTRVLDSIEDTSNILVGMSVLGTDAHGFPCIAAGSLVASVDSESQITLDRDIVFPPEELNNPVHADFNMPGTAQSITFGGGKRIAEAAIDIVFEVFGSMIGYRKLHDPAIILTDVYYSENRAEALAAVALAAAAESYFDGDGNYVFGPPLGSGAPVWDVDASETGVLVSADESLDRTGVYNGVLVVGQDAATSAPLSALVVDSDPSSPTRWGGPFGKVARIEQSTAVQTEAQAQAAAQRLLDERLAITRSLGLQAAPNPALELGDVVRVTFPDGRVEEHVIESIQLALEASGAQMLVVRSTSTPSAMSVHVPLPADGRRRVLYGRSAWRELHGARRLEGVR